MTDPVPENSRENKTPPVHILVIEDEEAHAELIRRSFPQGKDHPHLTVVKNLKEARVHLDHETPDIIIADWLLPDGKGIDVLPRENGLVTLPFVIMTSHGSEKLAVELLKSGAIDYIVKSGSTFRELPHIVDRVLREWKNIRERKEAEEALARSESKYRLLHESIRDALATVNLEGTLQDFNPAFCDLLGYSGDELLRMTYRDLTPEKWHAYEGKIIEEQVLQRGYSDVYEKEDPKEGRDDFSCRIACVPPP